MLPTKGAITTALTYVSSNILTETVLTFSPQITAFTPTETDSFNGCSRSVYCDTTTGAVLAGRECLAWDALNRTNNIPFRDECYPEGYVPIFLGPNGWSESTRPIRFCLFLLACNGSIKVWFWLLDDN